MAQYKVYVTDYEYASLQYEEKEIAKIDADVIPLQCKTEDELIAQASDADALLVQYAPVTARVMDALPNLKIISRYGVGVDTVDIAAATARDIVVVNVPDYGIAEVSDHAFALLMTLLRDVTFLSNDIKSGNWDFKVAKPLYRLSKLTLGVVGAGRIGKEFIRKAKPFGFTILVTDPYLAAEDIEALGAKKVPFDQLLAESDAISIHAPLYDETYHLFSTDAFSKMKEGAMLVNTARGGLVDSNALIEALEQGTLRCAALDVCEAEPIELDNRLKSIDRVILTPHIAWYSEQSQVDLQRKAAEEVVRVLSGQQALNPVNNKKF